MVRQNHDGIHSKRMKRFYLPKRVSQYIDSFGQQRFPPVRNIDSKKVNPAFAFVAMIVSHIPAIVDGFRLPPLPILLAKTNSRLYISHPVASHRMNPVHQSGQ